MYDKSFAVKLGTFVGMVTSVVLIAKIAWAQQEASPVVPPISAAETACFSGPARLSETAVQKFLNAPAGLLTDFPTGGLPLSTRIRSLAGSNAATLDPILSLVASANSVQAAAIGAGLARAAKACEQINPEYAATIQDKIAALGNDALELAFQTASNEVQTAALGQAAGLGGGTTAAGIGGTGTAGGGSNGIAGSTASTGTSSGSFVVNGSSFSDNGGGGAFNENNDDVSRVVQ